MAPSLSKLLLGQSKDTYVFTIASSAAIIYWLQSIVRNQRKQKEKGQLKFLLGEDKDGGKKKIQVNREFLTSVRGILKVLVPSVWSKEAGYLGLVAGILVFRSLCDIWMIHNGTLIESAIISKDFTHFRKNLTDFVKAIPTLALVNTMLKFGLSELKLCFRVRLSAHLYNDYLSGYTYYKMNNLDNRISNADQLLTQDVERFCDSVVDLYSNISKPILDILIYVYKLTQAIGAQAPGVMLLYLCVSGTLLTRLRRPVSRLTAEEQRLEGELRFVHSRLITNSEEIAFYNGNTREKKTIDAAFYRLVDHLRSCISFRFSMGYVDDIVAKYLALFVGFSVVAYPYFTDSNLAQAAYKDRMQDYYRSGRMLVKLAQSVGRVVLAGRELTRLVGYTTRVQELMTVLKDVKAGNYTRTMLVSTKQNEGLGPLPAITSSSRGRVIIEDNVIKFHAVPLVTPNGDVLVRQLTFEVKSGVNVLVCGPNGCGKSSLFRILGELWPVFGGTLTKPSIGKLFYIPQRPYMTLGTLRDQVIYPDSVSRLDDGALWALLNRVKLTNIVEREGGWDAVADWMDVLSGGEKQRIAMARVFYHRPQFAILDECTSAVSVDVEDSMYRHCREIGITLFTVTHRKSLWKHHQYFLHMDGRGSFEYKAIEDGTLEFGS